MTTKDFISTLHPITNELSILYVEDDLALLETTTILFEKIFAKVDTAINGKDGIEKFKDSISKNIPYDLIISDIAMPELNGLDMLKEVRHIKKNQKFIFISASGDSEYLLESIKLGIDGFFIKPLDYAQAEEVLSKICTSINNAKQMRTYVKSIESLNKALMQHNHRAEFNEMKNNILRNLSHEIKTPLNSIQSAIQIVLKSVSDNPKTIQISQTIYDGIFKIVKLIDRMVQLSHLQSDNYELKHEKTVLDTHIFDMIENLDKMAKDKGVVFYSTIDPIFSSSITCDPETIKTIIHELVDNAIKFSPAEKCVILNINFNVSSQTITIKVKDDGIGMNREIKKHCFDLFYQGDATLTRSSEGSGIGLTLVKQMLHLLEGTVRIDTDENSGTLITVDIPLK